jgi:transcriptional regulator with XRE-family HTH domain
MVTALRSTPLSAADLGEVLRLARAEAGLTQTQLADAVGTTQSAISRWEHGDDTPRLDSFGRIMSACGVEVDLTYRRHDDVDRSQIREHLRMTPAQRLDSQRNVAEFLASARRR